jgi:gamma-glutamylcyclotransferase
VTVLLFAYGSNMAEEEIAAFCPEHRCVGPARLAGFRVELRRRSIRWGGGAVDVVESPGEEVWGVLYELPDRALDGLDAKEGAGFAYRRREVEVERGDERVRALVYEVIDKEAEQVPCTSDYAALLIGGARERGLPKGWVEHLDAVLAPARDGA